MENQRKKITKKTFVLATIFIFLFQSLALGKDLSRERELERRLRDNPGSVDHSYFSEDDGDFDSGDDNDSGNSDADYSPHIQMGHPSYGGSGCPEGSIGTALSPDNKTLSVLFDEYIAEAGESVSKRRGRKDCNMIVPFTVPEGYRVAIVKIDYRGFNSIPQNGKAKFTAVYYFTDSATGKAYTKSFRRKKVFRGPMEDDFTISSKFRRKAAWSQCGKDFNLHINTQALAVSNRQLEDVITSLDSMDAQVNQNVRYHMLWKRCSGDEDTNPRVRQPRNRHRTRPARRNHRPRRIDARNHRRAARYSR